MSPISQIAKKRCKIRVGRKPGNCVSHIETKSNVANNLAITGLFKGVYTNH
jgi:hypothetical protein